MGKVGYGTERESRKNGGRRNREMESRKGGQRRRALSPTCLLATLISLPVILLSVIQQIFVVSTMPRCPRGLGHIPEQPRQGSSSS